jgi:Protein of unknown function (DUF3080)
MNTKRQVTSRCGLMVVCLYLLSACSGSGVDDPFREYLERLGRTLDTPVELAPLDHTRVPNPPRPGKLRIDIGADKLGTLDFMDLRGCELQVTIGKANSSLGRLARDSQKLLLALEYLRLAPACIEFLAAQGEQTLAEKLELARLNKTQQLPALIFNATLGSDEYQALWQSVKSGADYPDNTSSVVISALTAIEQSSQRWLGGDYAADNLTFEIQLSEVARGDAGQLWRALAHQQQWLARANEVLQQRLQQGPLCTPTRRPAAADILPRVVHRFFIDGIQPRAAKLGSRYHQLLPPIQALENRLAMSLPVNFLQWRDQRDSNLERLINAPRRHVAELQKVLADCEGNP